MAFQLNFLYFIRNYHCFHNTISGPHHEETRAAELPSDVNFRQSTMGNRGKFWKEDWVTAYAHLEIGHSAIRDGFVGPLLSCCTASSEGRSKTAFSVDS